MLVALQLIYGFITLKCINYVQKHLSTDNNLLLVLEIFAK